MIQKKKILIFSDCFVYSGSEVVIENLLLSEKLNDLFDVRFLYGYNKSYSERFKQRVELLNLDEQKATSIFLLSPDWSIYQYNLLKGLSIGRIIFLIRVILLKTLKFLCLSHIFNFFSLKKAFKKASPDLIYINNGGYPASLQCCLAVFAADAAGIEKIYFNINNMSMPPKRFYEKYMDRLINEKVTGFITASYAAQRQAVQTRGFEKQLFKRIPNTIFNDEQIPNAYRMNKSKEKLIFGSIGLLTERKGYHVLLKAVQILVERYYMTNFEVVFVGDGEDKSMLINKSKAYNIEKYVKFLGFKSNPLVELKEFDVFILPSIRNEDFPYVILEAMLLSKPIIGTNVAGIPEQIVNEKNGYVVEANNPEELAIAMMKMKEGKISEMGVNSFEIYKSSFSFKKIEGKYCELFVS